jgi:hypothetical protein
MYYISFQCENGGVRKGVCERARTLDIKFFKNKTDNRLSMELRLLLNLYFSKDMSGIKFYYMWSQFYLVGTF